VIPAGRQIHVPARWALAHTALLLGPLVVVLDRSDAVGDLTAVRSPAAVALLPLSWLIGEATDNLAFYTGPAIGGFLNATFGNAPELIIAIIAVSDGLTEIVRASLVGSIAGNLLLVLGFTLLWAAEARSDRRSAYILARSCRSRHRCFPRRSRTGVPRRSGPATLAELALPLAYCSWSFA